MIALALLGWTLVQADDKEAESAIERFKAAYASPAAQIRALAVSELARTRHEKVLRKIASLVVSDDKAVRTAASKEIGDFRDYAKLAVPILLAGLSANAKEPEVRIAILGALGKLQDEAALSIVHALFREKDARVAKAAIEAAGTIRSASSVNPLLTLMKELEKCIKNGNPGGYRGPRGVGEEGDQQERLQGLFDAGLQAMKSITREPWSTLQEWQLWWKKRQHTFKAEK